MKPRAALSPQWSDAGETPTGAPHHATRHQTRQARARQAPGAGRVSAPRPRQPHHRHEGPRATGAPGPRGRRRSRRGRHEERARQARPGGRHAVTREPDAVTLRRLDWDRSDEELADALGQPVRLIKAWRGKAFWRRGRIDSPPPWLVERWRQEARTRTVTELARMWGLT